METQKKRLVVLTGAGISAESGIKTFRDSDGLWETHRVEDVATPEAWQRNPELVQSFYNKRRKQLLGASPNAGHIALAEAERWFDIAIITQNIDDLHERAGSSHVLHLHGELKKARSERNEQLIYPISGWELKMGQKAEDGAQLRPHIVWFGEAVPRFEEAIRIAQQADLFAVVGTSMVVYPAASLIQYTATTIPHFLVDPSPVDVAGNIAIEVIREKASIGVPLLISRLRKIAYANL